MNSVLRQFLESALCTKILFKILFLLTYFSISHYTPINWLFPQPLSFFTYICLLVFLSSSFFPTYLPFSLPSNMVDSGIIH